MAREEHDREDLLREATALVRRAEFAAQSGENESLVIGFRRDGAGSIYFGTSRAYHFHSSGTLRRAFLEGLLFKAVGGRLVRMERRRTAEESVLVSLSLPAEESETFLAEGARLVADVATALQKQSLRLVGQVPADDAELRADILSWLNRLSARWSIAERPHVG